MATHPYDAITVEALRSRRSEKWRAFPPDVLPAWVAEMDFPLAEPIAAVLHEMVSRGDTGYANPLTLPEAYAEFASARFGMRSDPTRTVLLPDVVQGIAVGLELFAEPGGGVVVNTPAYPPFFSMIGWTGRRMVEAPLARDGRTGRYELDLDALERAFRGGARTYLLCNPHNPTGRVFSRHELEAAAQLADHHGVMVLADEVHGPVVYPPARHVPFASLDSPAARRSMTFVSASKAWNLAGLKCALGVVSSAETWETVQAAPREIAFGASILGVAANEAAFREGLPWLENTLAYLDGNRDLLDELLRTHLPEVRWAPPEGTYLAWLDCTALGPGPDPAVPFLERGRVAVVPGPTFGGGGPTGDGFVRLNFATPRPILTEAVRRMATAASGIGEERSGEPAPTTTTPSAHSGDPPTAGWSR
jgi:cysteine-S-conjugate beta-lyase